MSRLNAVMQKIKEATSFFLLISVCSAHLTKVDRLVADYILNGRTWSAEKRADQLEEIHKSFGDARSVSEEKVQLAGQTYELVS